MDRNEPILACDLTAIPADVREEHVVNAPQLFATAQEVRELADGFAIRFDNDAGKFMSIARFIENERRCCPFFRFSVDVEPSGGPIWLRLTGGEGVKELLRSGLLEDDNEGNVLKKLIKTGGDAHLDETVRQTSFPQLADVLNNTSNE